VSTMKSKDQELSLSCSCQKKRHILKQIVLTGGPGAGKTAVLEMARQSLCHHVAILPESASIIFRGGFWRKSSIPARQAAQRAIFHVQRELEQMVYEEKEAAIALCDRGSLDSLAYWPSSRASYFKQLNTTIEDELARYYAVIHLRVPAQISGYNHSNPVRIENAHQAHIIDKKIEDVWRKHPRRFIVESTPDFLTKAKTTMALIEKELSVCCKGKFHHAKNNHRVGQ
jgi:predicted ATPase